MELEYFNPKLMILVSNISYFQKGHYQMFSFNYSTSYFDDYLISEEQCVLATVSFFLISLIYFVTAHMVLACVMYESQDTSNKNNQTNKNLEEFINDVSCVKVPSVFSVVAKEYFKTETNMYLIYAGKLSLGRHLASKVDRVDKTQKYLTQKDPMTKKEYQFLRYTTMDVDNMKTETRQWIINNKSNWVSYFAY